MKLFTTALLAIFMPSSAYAEDCIASIYSTKDRLQNGTTTASGTRLNDAAMTAAHRSLPFGTKVTVTNRANGKSVIVSITDRGPYYNKARCIDLTPGAGRAIGISGLGKVTVTPSGRSDVPLTAYGEARADLFGHRFDAAFPDRGQIGDP